MTDPLPRTLEICTRRFNDAPCLGIIYRPQPDASVCRRCSGKEAGVVYVQQQVARSEWNLAKPIDAPPVCSGCGGPHPFDTSIPSPTWNRVIRGGGLPDYLCTTCIVRAFVDAGESVTAELWGPGLHGVPIEIRVRSAEAKTAADLSNENTALRVRVAELEAGDGHAS